MKLLNADRSGTRNLDKRFRKLFAPNTAFEVLLCTQLTRGKVVVDVLPWHHENIRLFIENADGFVDVGPTAVLNDDLQIRHIGRDPVNIFGTTILHERTQQTTLSRGDQHSLF
ncbi:MAG: hypothetical protein Ct9H300mP26_3160 [Acidimicrobiales bacterium]|nr:MAG: hypothetical protein Ct9H300mP26_3160 [Acidimicrobiales bacterium]